MCEAVLKKLGQMPIVNVTGAPLTFDLFLRGLLILWKQVFVVVLNMQEKFVHFAVLSIVALFPFTVECCFVVGDVVSVPGIIVAFWKCRKTVDKGFSECPQMGVITMIVDMAV
jgi:hypothetical protein